MVEDDVRYAEVGVHYCGSHYCGAYGLKIAYGVRKTH